MDDLNFAIQLAQETGQLLKEYFSPHGSSTQLKPDQSVLTEADLAADEKIAAAIESQYPEDSLISEELQPIHREKPSNSNNRVWVVDPLDGTTNFSLGLPIWGVSIALLVDGWPEIAALCFPMFAELYSARRGAGAHLNGKPLQVAQSNSGHNTSFFSTCSRTYRLYEVGIRYKPRILGSAAYTFCAVSRGLAILGFEATSKIWDIAAGWLLVNEAHGSVATIQETQPFPLVPDVDYRERNYPTLVAASPRLLEKAHRQLEPKSAG